MTEPLVSVICLCHNQSAFVMEAITSVKNQTYQNIELIVVDDASTDDSVEVIHQCLKLYSDIQFIPLKRNVGNCKAFNHGLRFSHGEYVIDLAADDLLLPDRISRGVQAFNAAGECFGVNFTDAEWITADAKKLRIHSERFPHDTVPQGDVYVQLIRRFFICSPTMMYRGALIRALGGYDETLAYEDFDFWIRSSRDHHYCYTPEILVKKRVVKRSMSEKQFSLFSRQLHSTYRVCEKIMALNRSTVEQKALSERLRYEMRVSIRLLAFRLAVKYVRLYFRNRRMRYLN